MDIDNDPDEKYSLYNLLPSIYRERDSKSDFFLKKICNIIDNAFKLTMDSIKKTYDIPFIETCDDWAIPYIAANINASIPYAVTNSKYGQRAWIANTISFRKHKGTVSMLEQLARDATNWPAKVVEFFQFINFVPNVNYNPNKSSIFIPDIRDIAKLDRLMSPFERISHMLDIREIGSSKGLYNIENIGIFLWRIKSLPVLDAPAYYHGSTNFSFNQFGFDVPIFKKGKPLGERYDMAEEINIDGPLNIQTLKDNLDDYYYEYEKYDEDTSNPDISSLTEHKKKSLSLKVNDKIIGTNSIIVCSLKDWNIQIPKGKVAIDPVLGRIRFPENELPKSVYVNYYYGFSSEIGGGFYIRKRCSFGDLKNYSLEDSDEPIHYKISKKQDVVESLKNYVFSSITDAIKKWKEDGKKNSIFEILDSEFYNENNLLFDIPSETQIIFQSKQKERPVLRLGNAMKIKGNKNSRLILDGIVFDKIYDQSYSNMENKNNCLINILPGDLRHLIVSQCTLAPDREGDYVVNNPDRFLFSWQDLCSCQHHIINKLKDFLISHFKNFDWLYEPEVVFEVVSPTQLRLFDSIAPNKYIYLIMVLQDDDPFNFSSFEKFIPKVLVAFVTSPKLIENKRISLGDVLYDFIVFESDNQHYLYDPKISILMNGQKTNNNLDIKINESICGRILITDSEATINLDNSILDAKLTANCDSLRAYKGNINRSTIFGDVYLKSLVMASDSLFVNNFFVKRRQTGCIRFCYVTSKSLTPSRYRCQPEYFLSILPTFSTDKNLYSNNNSLNVPIFTSVNFGDPGYAQLSKFCPKVFLEGSSNGSEMGIFNNLYQTQRINNLLAAIDEYLPVGIKAGIFIVS